MVQGLRKTAHTLFVLAATACSTSSVALEINDQLDISGFARVIGGYIDDNEAQLNGYQDEVTLKQQSLLALQPTFRFNEQFALTGQFIAHSNSERKSGTEWLYLSYSPNNSWQFRAGKLRMPTYAYSDSIDVGYSYPWITPPLQVYNNYLAPTFTGISGSYNYAGREYALYLEGYYGYFDGEILQAGSRVDISANVKDIIGVTARLSHQNLSLRLSYNTGYNKSDVPQLEPIQNALEQAGFHNSASSLDDDGRTSFYEAAISYDDFDSFFKAEWTRAETELDLAPSLDGYYFTAGYLWQDWTLHFTYGASSYTNVKAQQELQGVLNTALQKLGQQQPLTAIETISLQYFGLFDSAPDGSLDSYTLGTRWDFRLNMAFKAEVTYLNETSPRSGFFGTRFTSGLPSDLNKKNDATLLQLGWEWVF